jgi:peptidoglycan-N-acetylglucosamine deacetylase
MEGMMNQSNGWGPEGARAALNITFDNLGAVAEEEIGLPSMMGEGGVHASIEVLPDLLRILNGIKVTYFIEGWNCGAHPEEIKSIYQAGHEVAVHGWRHENWANTAVSTRKEALKKAVDAFTAMGVDVAGFRPPGGKIDLAELKAECQAVGLSYASPLGAIGDDRNDGEFITFPFAWQHVDAYMLNPDLGALRQTFGDPEEPYSLEQWGTLIEELLEKIKQDGTHATLIFHPFMLKQSEKALEIFAKLVKSVREDDDIWTPTCGELAVWMRRSQAA